MPPPLCAVYRREQHLRRRFLAEIDPQPLAAPHQGVSPLDQVLLLLLTASWLCLMVRYLAEGGMDRIVGTSEEEACPGAAW